MRLCIKILNFKTRNGIVFFAATYTCSTTASFKFLMHLVPQDKLCLSNYYYCYHCGDRRYYSYVILIIINDNDDDDDFLIKTYL